MILSTFLYCLQCTVLLELHVRQIESFWIRCLRIILGSRSGGRSVTLRCARWLNTKGSHRFFYNIVSVFLDISQGCQIIAYSCSFFCLLLLVASAMLVDRIVVGMMLYLMTSNSVPCQNPGGRKIESASFGAPSSNIGQSISTRNKKQREELQR